MTSLVNNTSSTILKIKEPPALIITQALIMIFSNINNIVVIIALMQKTSCRKMRTFNALIIALSVSDVILIESSIPTNFVISKHGFIFGEVGCYIIYPLATMASNLTVMLLLCISTERYVAISHPILWKSRSYSAVNILFGNILFSLVTVIPYSVHLKLIYDETKLEYQCIESWSNESSKIYTLFLFFIQYAVPLTIMMVLYSKAWYHLYQENKRTIKVYSHISDALPILTPKPQKRERKLGQANILDSPNCITGINHIEVRRKQGYQVSSNIMYARKRRSQTINTFFMFLLVVIVFAVCSLPNQITWLWSIYFADSGTTISKTVKEIFYNIHFMNCVLNPLIYGGISKTMRQKIFNVFIYHRGRSRTLENDETESKKRTNTYKRSRDHSFTKHFRLSRYQKSSLPIDFQTC